MNKLRCYTPVSPVIVISVLLFRYISVVLPLILLGIIIYRKKRSHKVKKLTVTLVIVLIVSLTYWGAVYYRNEINPEPEPIYNTDYPDAKALGIDIPLAPPGGCGSKSISGYLFDL